jgi:catechol 2,3-dioxygenase-like lactoylglutathione lyase family enzyme
MPNIENLRKQAKRIVRWHREGHHPVAPLIRAHFPAFKDMSDLDILKQRFRLTDAQEVVARQCGFSSWQALLEGVQQMPNSPSTNAAQAGFIRAEAQILVRDLSRSLQFYNELLRFETRFSYGEPPFYAQVVRGGAHLNLRAAPELQRDPADAQREEYLAATICVDSIKEIFLAYQEAGVELFQTLRTEPWGARTFIVADPDGNLLLFAE